MTNAEQPLSILPLNRHEDCRWQRDDDQKVVDTVIARAEKAEAQLEAQVKELECTENVKFELRRQIKELEAQLRATKKEIVSNHKGLVLLNKFYEEEIVKRFEAEEKVKALEALPKFTLKEVAHIIINLDRTNYDMDTPIIAKLELIAKQPEVKE